MSRTLLAAVFAAQLAAASSYAETVDDIIAKHVKAVGGLEKLKSIKTERITAKVEASGMEIPITILQKRPRMIRTDTTIQGMVQIQAYDGKDGWSVSPFQGKKDPEPMSPEEVKRLDNRADMDGVLVDYKAKGHKVELIGKDKVEGSDAYKLKVTLKNGDVDTMYLDADSFLLVKTEGKRMIRGTESEFETSLGDYKPVQGMMMPFSLEAGAKGSHVKQKVTITKIELNVPIDDALFKMPAKGPPKPPTPPAPPAGPKP